MIPGVNTEHTIKILACERLGGHRTEVRERSSLAGDLPEARQCFRMITLQVTVQSNFSGINRTRVGASG